MRRFKFRLQTALEVTRRREDVLYQELKKRQAAYQQAAEELSRLQKLHAKLAEDLNRSCREGLAAEMIRLFKNYMQVLEEELKQQKTAVDRKKAELERCRAELLFYMKKRKVMEKLRQRRWEEYCYWLQREEQKELDETAASRFIANQEA